MRPAGSCAGRGRDAACAAPLTLGALVQAEAENNADAQFNLGCYHAAGLGMPVNEVRVREDGLPVLSAL